MRAIRAKGKKMSLSVIIDKKQMQRFKKDLEKEQEKLEENLLAFMGIEAVSLIRQRVSKGIGTDDAPMKAYSESYAKYKHGKGRNVSKRDLVFSGRMLGSMTMDGPFLHGDKPFVTVTFGGGPEIQIRASENEINTPFFGLSKQDQKHLRDAVEGFMQSYFESKT